ncbi:MAG: hypothetical protein ACUVTX_04075 [Bacteroidales bacterium]
MKKLFGITIVLFILTGLSGLPSCKSKSAQDKKIGNQEKQQVETIKKEIEKNVYPLPTSAEVIKMLTELEVGYIIGISNPASNAKKYIQSSAQAINIGVYGADLSYATLYNMQQYVNDYLDAVRILSNSLNMSRIYDTQLYDSIKVNFDNRDKLVSILENAFNETYQYLSENQLQNLALLVVGGAWVEGMYLTTHVSEAAYNVAGISRVLLEQKKSFELYLDITKQRLDDPLVGDFVKLLDPMKKVYEGLTTSLTEKNIKDITDAISVIRGKIIQ